MMHRKLGYGLSLVGLLTAWQILALASVPMAAVPQSEQTHIQVATATNKTTALQFPEAWVGTWQGSCQASMIDPNPNVPSRFDMGLTVKPKSKNRWEWTIRYQGPQLKQIPRSSRRNPLPVECINRSLLMRHKHLTCTLVELMQIGKTPSGADRILHHPPEAFNGVEVMATMGR